jgi:hypothetical protein
MMVGGVTRAARLLAALIACIAALEGAAAAATAPVRPTLGRWEGRAGPARVVFTVEETRHGARYVVRPVVYCDPGNSTFFETSLFNLSQTDAWPISRRGSLSDAPLVGRFGPDRAVLRIAVDGTCGARGTRFTAEPKTAHPTVPDGDWMTQLAPHPNGLIGEFAILRTRGEGATIDSDWGVYDGLESCYFQRTGLEILVEPDGSFSATINGNQLSSQNVTIHVSGNFVASNVVHGTYTLTGPGCTAGPVEFAGVLTSAYAPPNPAGGSATLINPQHGPGGGGESPPEGAECKDAATLSPRFAPEEKREIKLGSFGNDSLPLKVTASLTLGSVGLCDRAIDAVRTGLTKALSGLDVEATYKRAARKVNSTFRYTFLPLGWHLPRGTGAPEPEAPTIDWPSVTFTLPGGIENPSLNFVWSPGKPVAPEFELIKVPVLQGTVTLISLGHPFLSARLGPELSLSLQLNEKELDKDVDEAVAEGEPPAAAAQELADATEIQLKVLIDVEEGALSPEQPPPAVFAADAASLSGALGRVVDTSLAVAAGSGPIADSVEAEAITRGLLGSPTFVGEAEEIAGRAVIELLPEALAASADRRLPPGVHRINGPVVARLLRARPIHRLSRRALRRAPFPKRRIGALIRETYPLEAVPVRVGRLVVTTRHLHPGGTIAVIAPFLGPSPGHDALLTLAGPGFRAARLLHVSHGAAGAVIRLPKHLAHGTWTISVEDLSGVGLGPDGVSLTGSATVRMGVFAVR